MNLEEENKRLRSTLQSLFVACGKLKDLTGIADEMINAGNLLLTKSNNTFITLEESRKRRAIHPRRNYK